MERGEIGEVSWLKTLAVLSAFVLLFGLITITSFLQKSPTYDESIHLFAGYSYLKDGDFRINPEHPPFAKLLAALPLLALDIKDARLSDPAWELALKKRDFTWWALAHNMIFLDNDAETLFFYAKLPMIASGILLGIFVYIWSKAIYGVKTAIASLSIYCLDPNILAHSQIVHTDIPFTTFLFIGTYFFWRALTRLTWSNLFLTSLFFGLAVITKYSFLAVLPIWGTLGALKVLSAEPQACRIGEPRVVSGRMGKAALSAGVILCALIAAYILIWGVYGLRFDPLSQGGERHLPIERVMPENTLVRAPVHFATLHQLFPEAWIFGLLYVARFLRRPVYLLGQISEDGFWHYFPVVFAVKTPLPTLLLLLAAIGLMIFKRRERRAEWFPILPIVIYFSLAVWSRLNLGLRHLLPLYPFLIVWLGGTAAELWRSGGSMRRGVLALIGLWYLWSSVGSYPHYLAFFNELAGGSRNGYKVLTDSSLDWGQDLKGLKRWMDQNGIKKIQLAYFGTADPNYYGIDAVYLPGSIIFSPRPESRSAEVPNYLAVSATYLYGVHSEKFLGGLYKPLRRETPATVIGHSIFVYKLD